MATQNVLLQKKLSFDISGKGKTEEEAYSDVFARVKTEVYREVPGVVLQMEPEEVILLSRKEEKKEEKFLFLFFPREKSEYEIKVKLVVSVKYIEVKGD